MLHIYFFKSSEERDGLSCLTIISSSSKRAYGLAVINFLNQINYGKERSNCSAVEEW